MEDTFTPIGEAAEAVVEKVAKKIAYADGVYFGLEEDKYHADPALGSTSMKTLAVSPPDYWAGSPHNPDREPDEDTPSRLFGRALHKFLLEGEEAFADVYAPTRHNGSTKDGKAERAAIAEEGKTAIRGDDYDRILKSGPAIRRNPDFNFAFSGGMPEVSIFWTRDGIRRKARIDYLKPRASVDLKSVANQQRREFPEACRRAIADFRYDVQAAHYNEAREQLRAFYAKGFWEGDHDEALFERIVGANTWSFVWLFYQTSGAPIAYGTYVNSGHSLLDYGKATIARAEENYRAYVERFGLDQPWYLTEPMRELDIQEMPKWAFN